MVLPFLIFGLILVVVEANINEADISFFRAERGNNVTSQASTNTYAQAISYAKNTQHAMEVLGMDGNLPESSACPTAIDAYHKSKVVSKDINSAPSGAFHWWDIGTDGHVAMATTGGWSLMASCHVTEFWGDCIGVTSVIGYTSTTGGKYLGWSYDYASSEIADVHQNEKPSAKPTNKPSAKPNQPTAPTNSVGRSATEDTGVPDTNYYKRQQLYASKYGYTGPIDGVLGVNSWAGTQVGLRNYGYTGPCDGIPATNTYMAMQRLASKYGYTGPIDGVLGINSYKGIAKYFNTL